MARTPKPAQDDPALDKSVLRHNRATVVGADAKAAAATAFVRAGFSDPTLVLRWNEIAGPEVAQAIQLGIEYDPEPPFDAGTPEAAGPELVEVVRRSEGIAG